MFRERYIDDKTAKKNKQMFISKVRVVVNSRGEGKDFGLGVGHRFLWGAGNGLFVNLGGDQMNFNL